MKTILPKRSLEVQNRLDYIMQQILTVAKDKIAMIILYGSYARGDWVKDMYMEDHITYSYISDFDFLVVLKKGKFKEHATLRIESKIEKRLEQTGLRKAKVFSLEPWISIICESISEVNTQLEKGRYFYTDIKKEGVLLYDSGEFTLSEAKDLPWSEVKEIAKEDYKLWFNRGIDFFIDCKYPLERGRFNKSAGFVAWLKKNAVCHSCESRNPEKNEINRVFNFTNLRFL